MGKINFFIEKNIYKILSIFFILQPILDVIAAFSLNYFKIQLTFSSIIRFIFLFFCLYYLIFLSHKKRSIIYVLLFLIYILCFSLITIVTKNSSTLFYELKNVFNVFYFPIILLSFSDMIKGHKIDIKNIVYLYLIYIILVFFPNLTHTAFISYNESKVGSTGWFLSANSVGNIVGILFPFILFYILTTEKKYFLKLFLIGSSLYVFLSIGTKTPLLSFLICIIGTFIYYFVLWIKNRSYKKILISLISGFICISTFIILIPRTSFYKNIQIHKDFLNIDSYSDILKDYKLIDHFIFSQRLTFLSDTANYYNTVDVFQKIFGIGYIEKNGSDLVSLKTIEMDYFDILFRNGFLGFVLFSSGIILALFENKRKFDLNSLLDFEIIISFILILLLALFSGHVFVYPSVSIIVTFILLIYFQGGLYEENYER